MVLLKLNAQAFPLECTCLRHNYEVIEIASVKMLIYRALKVGLFCSQKMANLIQGSDSAGNRCQ